LTLISTETGDDSLKRRDQRYSTGKQIKSYCRKEMLILLWVLNSESFLI
jgi:hypothetical protein